MAFALSQRETGSNHGADWPGWLAIARRTVERPNAFFVPRLARSGRTSHNLDATILAGREGVLRLRSKEDLPPAHLTVRSRARSFGALWTQARPRLVWVQSPFQRDL